MITSPRATNILDYTQEEVNYFKNQLGQAQTDLEQIAITEKNRLGAKQQNMDVKLSNARRMLMISQSYRDKYRMYTFLVATIIISAALCIGLVHFQSKLKLSSTFLNLIVLAIIFMAFTTCVYLYLNISKRDSLDFSKRSPTSLRVPPSRENSSGTGNIGNLGNSNNGGTNNVSLCKGAECCGPGFQYSKGKCEFKVQ